MDSKILLATVLLILALCSCAKGGDGKYSGYFEDGKPVDLSDVLNVYVEHKKAEADSVEYDLAKVLEGGAAEDYDGIELIDNADFAIQLPQCANSTNPFLSRAEVFYNSCLFAFNVWSNYEMWIRELTGTKETCTAIQGIGTGCIENLAIRSAAKVYQDSLILKMKTSDEQRDVDAMGLLMSYSTKIESQAYRYYTNEEAFVDSLDAMTKELADKTRTQFELYKRADADKRLELMLHLLSDCKTFDEQCSLLLNWADCEESEVEDPWIVAVAGRLLRADKYNPCLNNLWIIWRCLFQTEYYGISRDSSIPNDFYNEMRKRCYLTCLKRIEAHSDDVFAMNCAAAIGGRVNINRFGEFPFGNEAPTEAFYSMPNRYADEDEYEEGDSISSETEEMPQDTVE